MFKYVIVALALIAAVFAAPNPKPALLYTPSAYSYSESYRPAAAPVYSSAYVPSAYSGAYYGAPLAYSAGYPAAYVY